MPLTTAEKNRRKRERKKREREAKRKENLASADSTKEEGKNDSVEIEYVSEPVVAFATSSSTEGDGKRDEEDDDMASVLRRFQARSAVLVSDDDTTDTNDKNKTVKNDEADDGGEDGETDTATELSKRKLRELTRPSISELKNRVARADLVEAHDVTAPDPDLLLHLKAVPGTVPVPRHWGRKRKYLQGKRGIEKPPFALPDFIVKTGITDIRSAVAEDESKMSAKQKNRSRVGPKMGAMDVDYRTLYDAFFKYQTKNSHKLTSFGDLYYEGKEFETNSKSYPVGILSDRLREALGMTTTPNSVCPPPWLIHMQRYGPPPSYPNLKIPGLNAPIPHGASYGYHVNGWGKPPVDAFGRPLYGGNPFDTTANSDPMKDSDVMFSTMTMTGTAGDNIAIVTSDGKTVGRKSWGALPTAQFDNEDEEEEDDNMEDESSSEEESSGEEEEEEGQEEEITNEEEIKKEKPEIVVAPPTLELRKGGEETPMPPPPQPLFTVLQQAAADKEKQSGAVFTSDTTYVLPSSNTVAGEKRKHDNQDHDDTEDDSDLAKKFKF